MTGKEGEDPKQLGDAVSKLAAMNSEQLLHTMKQKEHGKSGPAEIIPTGKRTARKRTKTAKATEAEEVEAELSAQAPPSKRTTKEKASAAPLFTPASVSTDAKAHATSSVPSLFKPVDTASIAGGHAEPHATDTPDAAVEAGNSEDAMQPAGKKGSEAVSAPPVAQNLTASATLAVGALQQMPVAAAEVPPATGDAEQLAAEGAADMNAAVPVAKEEKVLLFATPLSGKWRPSGSAPFCSPRKQCLL
jgi:hypothetical protein